MGEGLEQQGAGRRSGTHHLLQGGAAAKGAGQQREAVDEGGEEVGGQRRQGAPREHGDHIGDDIGDAHRLRVLDFDPERTKRFENNKSNGLFFGPDQKHRRRQKL